MGAVSHLLAIDRPTLTALAEADLARAAQLAGVAVDPGLLDELWLWRLRLEQVGHSPGDLPWLARLLVDDGVAVGHAGFHAAPDDSGLVELGYWVTPRRRGEGLGAECLRLLERWGRDEPRIRTLRACVSPANETSTHLVARAGFVPGDLVEDDEGPERVWELDVSG